MAKDLILKFKLVMKPTTIKKALYYWARLYTEELIVSEDYSLLSARGIDILNLVLFPDADKSSQ